MAREKNTKTSNEADDEAGSHASDSAEEKKLGGHKAKKAARRLRKEARQVEKSARQAARNARKQARAGRKNVRKAKKDAKIQAATLREKAKDILK